MSERTNIVIVGSGFSGLAMAVRLLRAGRGDFVVLERGDDVGGTWRDNTYPGCACDVPSHLYSFSFAPNPEWSATFSPQPEIQAYLRAVAERECVLPHVRLGCELEHARWDGEHGEWVLETSSGPLRARVLVAAGGALSEPLIPDIDGLEDFEGPVFHSATWDHGVDLTGKRVAVIGTGASAIQFVPAIAPDVARLDLYQRTPPWIVPRRARPLTRAERALYRRVPRAQLAMRAAIAAARESFALPMLDRRLSWLTRRLALSHMKRQVEDPALRAAVIPDYDPGCKRVLISNDYLPALQRPNVDLIRDGVAEIRDGAVVAGDGTRREVDAIILGTGFHVTDLPIVERLVGAAGSSLGDVWRAEGMSANRGTTVAGFPNLFFLLGPNTGTGHTSVMLLAEAQVDYVLRALEHLDATGAGALEVRAEAQAAWTASVQERMRGTVWTSGGCASWYLDARGVNTTLWPDFAFRFRRALARFDAGSYELHPATTSAAGAPARGSAPAQAAA